MGKKSKLKRRKYRYTKQEFVQAVCKHCGLCKSGVNPQFCYDGVYKDNPKQFIKTIFKNLKEVKRWLVNLGHQNLTKCSDDDVQYILQTAFCTSNYCGNASKGDRCEYLTGCLFEFRKQMTAAGDNIIVLNDHRGRSKKKLKKSKYQKKKKQRKAKIVKTPAVPTFFCNDGFLPKVKGILDGNDYREPDTAEKSTGDTSTSINGAAQDS